MRYALRAGAVVGKSRKYVSYLSYVSTAQGQMGQVGQVFSE